MSRFVLSSFSIACGLSLAVAACAQTREAPPRGLRVQVETQAEWTDVSAIAARVSQIAGYAVRDVGASSTQLFAMTLVCPDAAACDAGLQRLVQAHDVFVRAVVDARRTVPRPFLPSSAATR